MQQVQVAAGAIEVEITGEGPPVVLLHGLLMDQSMWDSTMPFLPAGYRYVRPVLPLGAHRIPMAPEADLSLYAMARMVWELLEALDLRGVTLVHTDWGGGLFLTALGLDDRVDRLVILPCEAFDNFPPGLPGKVAALATRIPGGIVVAARQLRVPWLRRRRLLFGLMVKHRIDQSLIVSWTESCLRDARIRRDLRKYTSSRFDKAELVERTQALADFQGEALVLWAPENRVMPMAHGESLAALMPHARLELVEDAFVLSMIDQPERVGAAITKFLTA